MLTATPKRLIEENLPAKFLFDLGLYLQTCAHIELMICALICELEGLEIQSDTWIVRHSSLRKMKSEKLFKMLSQATNESDRSNSFEPDVISELIDWMRAYIENRHIAVHGAFFITQEDSLRVNYWHVDKSRTPHKRTIEESIITHALAGELIDDADRILRTLWGALVAIGAVNGTLGQHFTHPSSMPE